VEHFPTTFNDGILTKRNTFQKYFEQQELQQYIEDALETTAVPVALGVFYVFRDPTDQQDFLSARSRRTIDWNQISARLGLGGPPKILWEALYREHKELLDPFGGLALKLGRFPVPNEFANLADIQQKLGSEKRALRAFVQGGGAPDLAPAETYHFAFSRAGELGLWLRRARRNKTQFGEPTPNGAGLTL
jgi:DNA phosphorothioation-associated putative methyltransferase